MTNLTLTRPLAVIDLETTSADVKTARIVEASVLRLTPLFADGSRLDGTGRTRRVNPGIPIPREATDIHGIADADVSACPPFSAIARGLADFLEGCDLCGFNLKRFDVKVLAAEFARSGLEFDLSGRAIIDVCEIYHKREPRDLEAAMRFYCSDSHEGAHSAEADVNATAKILDRMLLFYPDLPRESDKLAAAFVDPGAVDIEGFFKLAGSQIQFDKGKHKGAYVMDVANQHPDYLHWMLNTDFLPDTKRIAREALDREARMVEAEMSYNQPQPAKE